MAVSTSSLVSRSLLRPLVSSIQIWIHMMLILKEIAFEFVFNLREKDYSNIAFGFVDYCSKFAWEFLFLSDDRELFLLGGFDTLYATHILLLLSYLVLSSLYLSLSLSIYLSIHPLYSRMAMISAYCLLISGFALSWRARESGYMLIVYCHQLYWMCLLQARHDLRFFGIFHQKWNNKKKESFFARACLDH